MNNHLTRDVILEEVKKTFFSVGPHKTPIQIDL